MRKYIVTFTQPSEDIDPDCTTADDTLALTNGNLTVDDLMSLVQTGDITMMYEVVDELSCGHTFYMRTKEGIAACGEMDCNNYIH